MLPYQRIASFVILFLALTGLVTKPVFAAVDTVDSPGGFAQLSELTVVFANVAATVSTLAGFAVLIMLIRGGISYITAQGDPKALATARSTITWAIVGFIVILSAYLVISLIVGFVGIPGVGKFCLPTADQDAGACANG
jgi:hypothetical protein